MSAGKVLLGAVIGMATGAVLGVLFAPDKGSTTRRKMAKQGTRYMDDLKETASDCVDALESTLITSEKLRLTLPQERKVQ